MLPRNLQGSLRFPNGAFVLPFFYAFIALTAWAASPVLNQQPEPFFEGNQGQAPPEVLFWSYTSGYSAWLERDSLTLSFNRGNSSQGTSGLVRLRFLGASPQATVEGAEKQLGISNYFAGSDPAKWHTRIPHFSRVVYRQIYPGIDLVFYFRNRQLEYDVQLQPGADANLLHLRVEGADATLGPQGDVIISSSTHTELFRIKKPLVHPQERAGSRSLSAQYALRDHDLTVLPGQYDHSQQLVIDPALAFATFLGANCPEDPIQLFGCTSSINDLAVDDTGIYLVGTTGANSFPALPGQPPTTSHGTGRAVVVKLDPGGSKIIYTTFLASCGADSIAVDSVGAAYIKGEARTNPIFEPQPFPLTAGSFSPHLPASGTPVLPYAAKLSPDGATLVYSTFLMRDSGDPNVLSTLDLLSFERMTVDSNGALYVVGTVATDTNEIVKTSVLPFPTTVGAFKSARSGTNPTLFVMKLNPAGSALSYSTYIDVVTRGGGELAGIAVDSSGSAYVASSALAGYPTTAGAYQTANAGPTGFTDAVLTKLTPDGSALAYSTFFGGSSNDDGLNVAVTPAGEAVLVGYGFNPPTTPGAVCTVTNTHSVSAFAARFNSTGSALVYSTTFCNDPANTTNDQAAAVALDSSGNAYVFSFIENSFYPLLNPVQSYVFRAGSDAIAELSPTGTLVWSTLIGKDYTNNTYLEKVVVDSKGNTYFLFPDFTTAGAFEPVPFNSGTYVGKIVPSLGAPVPVLDPRTITFPNPQVVGSSSSPVHVIVGNFGDATLAMPTISITSDFSQTNTCTAAVLAAQKCDISVSFSPTAAGTRTGTLTVHFGGGLPDQTVSLSGTATAPVALTSPLLLVFGSQAVSTTSSSQSVTISNIGNGPLTISSLQTSGDFAQTNACGAPVQPGGNCTVSVTFTPTALGLRKGTLTLTDNAADSPQSVPLSGLGGDGPMPRLSILALGFPPQNVGSTSSSVAVTLTNVGDRTLNVSGVNVAGDFKQTNNCGAVAAGSNCTIQVSFAPTATLARNGTLTITDDSVASPETVALIGVGADFTFPPPPGSTTATISAGQTASYTLAVNSTPGMPETLSFSCSGLPSQSSCSFNPPSITVNGTAQNFTVNITTTAAGTVVNSPPGNLNWPLMMLATGLTASTLLLRKFRQIRWAVLVGSAVVLMWTGCGGGGGGGRGGNPGTPSGTYTVVVTATSTSGGSLSHSTNLTLVVK